MKFSENLLNSLDFNQIENYFTPYFTFSATKQYYKDRLFLEAEDIENCFSIVDEMFQLSEDELTIFDFLNQKDISNHIQYIDKEILLNPEDFLQIALVFDQFKKFSKRLDSKFKNRLKNLKNLIAQLMENYEPVDKIIFKIIDKNGLVKSTASQTLLNIRKNIQRFEKNIRSQINQYLKDKKLENFLQEDFYTVRKDRFVLPIKTSFRGTIEGIIHDRSNSGETVFIEPQEVVNINNQLILEKKREEAEIKRILKSLILELKPFIPSIDQMIDNYIELDLYLSRYKFSKKLDGNRVSLPSSFEINLRSVYNPLMKLTNEKTVAVNIELPAKKHAMIISGPNAGGKTVALKTVGMVYLLIYAGIFPPVAGGSSFYIYNNLFSIIGDNQSIKSNQSSFTSHLNELDNSFKNCKKGDLILIDEILQNTDPVTGAALARGFIDSIIEKTGYVILTTHYSELKYSALEDDSYLNVSVKLNQEMKPTYILYYNQISESLPFEIAKNIGISDSIVEKAAKYLEHSENSVNKLINKLNSQIDQYYDMNRKLKERENIYKKHKEEMRKFKIEKTQFSLKKEKLLKDEVEKTLTKMNKYLNSLEKTDKKVIKKNVEKLKKTSNKKDELINELRKDLNMETEQLKPIKNISVGDKVLIMKLQKNGEVTKIVKDKVTVVSGNIKITASIDDLAQPKKMKKEKKKEEKKFKKEQNDRKYIDTACVRTKNNTLELIGKDTFSSQYLMDQFIDKLFFEKRQFGFIIHGHGTGKLRNYVREYLKEHQLVSKYYRAPEKEGGDAITIIEL